MTTADGWLDGPLNEGADSEYGGKMSRRRGAVRFPRSLENASVQRLCPRRERLTLHAAWTALIAALTPLLIHHTDFQ